MSDYESKKCEPGSTAHALFRQADAEHRKVEELAKWRELLERFLNWIMQKKE